MIEGIKSSILKELQEERTDKVRVSSAFSLSL